MLCMYTPHSACVVHSGERSGEVGVRQAFRDLFLDCMCECEKGRKGGERKRGRQRVQILYEYQSCTDGLFPELKLLLCHSLQCTHFIMQCCAYK